jgi:putative membrane protein (TIGR04086 family)
VIASLRLHAVVLGVGIGSLTATVLALLFWGALTLVGFEDAPLAGLAAAVVLGFGASGYSAGRLAPHTHRFHGAVAGLGLAGLVLIMARLGGSQAPLGQIMLLFLLGIVLGGLGGIAGGRRG